MACVSPFQCRFRFESLESTDTFWPRYLGLKNSRISGSGGFYASFTNQTTFAYAYRRSLFRTGPGPVSNKSTGGLRSDSNDRPPGASNIELQLHAQERHEHTDSPQRHQSLRFQ